MMYYIACAWTAIVGGSLALLLFWSIFKELCEPDLDELRRMAWKKNEEFRQILMQEKYEMERSRRLFPQISDRND